MVTIFLTVVIILSEAGTIFTDNGSVNLRGMNILCNILGFALTPIIPIAIAEIFDSSIIKTYKYFLIPTYINIVATVLSPLFGFIFYVDASNHYIRGDYFFLFVIVYIINVLLLFICIIELGKKYNYPIMKKLIALSIFTIIGTSIQLIYPSAFSSWHCVTLSLLLFFLLMSEFDSSFDSLTGLYSRAAFDKATKQITESKAFSIIVLDINDFKRVNDTYGHDYGDTVIKAVATIVRRSFTKHYTCYRFGGDEIFVIGEETDQDKVENQIRIMISNLAEEREKGNPLPSVSYGYSIYRGEEELDFHKILKEADDQMYQFKKMQKTIIN